MDSSFYSDQYFYHTTSLENISSILCEGLLPRDSTHRESIEEDLIAVATEKGINLAVDRRDCVFCHPSLSQAVTPFELKTDDEEGLLGDRQGIVVIDREKITDEIFIGEYRLITDAITLQFKESPDEQMLASSYKDALQRYADSLIRISSLDTLENQCEQFENPEIVIADTISPQAIIGVFCDGHPLIEEYKQ